MRTSCPSAATETGSSLIPGVTTGELLIIGGLVFLMILVVILIESILYPDKIKDKIQK